MSSFQLPTAPLAMELPIDLYRTQLPPRVPHPSHRHGAPAGPWPFLDLDSEIDTAQFERPRQRFTQDLSQAIWTNYPHGLFPNWSLAQQEKSGITRIVRRASREPCTVYEVDVLNDGRFAGGPSVAVSSSNAAEYWEKLKEDRNPETRLRALFIDNLNGPVLQMLGTAYNIEPFFFSSSLNWIPSRYQEAVDEGDHITLTLTFIRSMINPTTMPNSPTSSFAPTVPTLQSADQVIDTHAPLGLSATNHILLPDILAIHMVRSPDGSTIISYHPPHTHQTTTAQTLRNRLLAAGQSVYWNKIFKNTVESDPTFVLLALLWYPLYAFDEALEALYTHICWLETRVMGITDMNLTQQLHVVRAHLLHYASLLEDFRKTVVFVADTPNPLLGRSSHLPEEQILLVQELMRRESSNLLNEIARLEQNRSMQDNRLKNVMNLAFSTVALEDSRTMRRLTEAAVHDSAAMKQISYLTMFFLPATFAATVFGMNIQELTHDTSGTLVHYIYVAIPLTLVTIWIIVAFQHRNRDPQNLIHDDSEESWWSFWHRFSWPILSIRRGFERSATLRSAKRSRSKSRSRAASNATNAPMSRPTSRVFHAYGP
ncbi:hypothetical protein MKEN_00529300 [Mycena kentingensis (nom. inval.)]|nr:hypothetical protein MKEN_00529300 [Mycena kentingensis (nom. inval.)]